MKEESAQAAPSSSKRARTLFEVAPTIPIPFLRVQIYVGIPA